MKRVTEPELMTEEEQARAYANANFEEAHSRYPQLFAETYPDRPARALVLDLGCGPCDVTIRFARANPGYVFHAVDGSAAMLKIARKTISMDPDLIERISLFEDTITDAMVPSRHYDVILSSSLLHHLHNPDALWHTIRRCAKTGTMVFVVDLFRPQIREQAHAIVEQYAADEPEILKRDFLNSLLAAFTVEEVRLQLVEAGLDTLRVREISDRHLLVTGVL